MKNITVNLKSSKTDQEEVLTFRELYEIILEEIDTYEKLGLRDELMEQKVILDIGDSQGKVIIGYSTLVPGWLEKGGFCIVGNLDGVY